MPTEKHLMHIHAEDFILKLSQLGLFYKGDDGSRLHLSFYPKESSYEHREFNSRLIIIYTFLMTCSQNFLGLELFGMKPDLGYIDDDEEAAEIEKSYTKRNIKEANEDAAKLLLSLGDMGIGMYSSGHGDIMDRSQSNISDCEECLFMRRKLAKDILHLIETN